MVGRNAVVVENPEEELRTQIEKLR